MMNENVTISSMKYFVVTTKISNYYYNHKGWVPTIL